VGRGGLLRTSADPLSRAPWGDGHLASDGSRAVPRWAAASRYVKIILKKLRPPCCWIVQETML